MSFWRGLRTLSGAVGAASAVWALLIGGIMAAFAFQRILFDPCVAADGRPYGICDPPPPPSALMVIAIALLLFGGILYLSKARMEVLLIGWATMVGFQVLDPLTLLIPSVRASVDPEGNLHVAEIILWQFSHPAGIAMLAGLGSAALARLLMRQREVLAG